MVSKPATGRLPRHVSTTMVLPIDVTTSACIDSGIMPSSSTKCGFNQSAFAAMISSALEPGNIPDASTEAMCCRTSVMLTSPTCHCMRVSPFGLGLEIADDLVLHTSNEIANLRYLGRARLLRRHRHAMGADFGEAADDAEIERRAGLPAA